MTVPESPFIVLVEMTDATFNGPDKTSSLRARALLHVTGFRTFSADVIRPVRILVPGSGTNRASH